MNENIDLSKILKDCPTGWKFYSSIYGEVEFVEILPKIPIKCREREDEWLGHEIMMQRQPIRFEAHGNTYGVSSSGEHIKGIGECTFFPSREQRDWSKFAAPWYNKEKFDPKTLQPFDKVLVRDKDNFTWKVDFFSHNRGSEAFPFRCVSNIYSYCIPYNNNTKLLVGTTDEAPDYYRYWED